MSLKISFGERIELRYDGNGLWLDIASANPVTVSTGTAAMT
jgi:hypothetical protein